MDVQELDNLNALLDQDVEIREKIKDQVMELDKQTRTMVGVLTKIHYTAVAQIPALLEQVQPTLDQCGAVFDRLASIVPENQFWRWKDMWSHDLRTAVFAASLVRYLSQRTLLSLEEAQQTLGLKAEYKDRVDLPAEDYLHGLINLVNELSRLAVNSVTMGNFEEPLKISAFVKDIFAGFSMLNLKNDLLRKRYDSLKYDIKKIEEVVYDVSLRRLAPAVQP